MVLIEDILEVPRDCIVDSVIPKKDVEKLLKICIIQINCVILWHS